MDPVDALTFDALVFADKVIEMDRLGHDLAPGTVAHLKWQTDMERLSRDPAIVQITKADRDIIASMAVDK